MKIDVGCGEWPKSGYIGIDKYARNKNNIIAEADNLPFNNNKISAIFCSHMIEHIPENNVTNVLQEFNRVLKKGGMMEIICPDLERSMEMWLEGDYEYKWGIGLKKIFGWQWNWGEFHFTGFNKERLEDILEEHSFKIKKIENRPAKSPKEREQFPDIDIYAKAIKL